MEKLKLTYRGKELTFEVEIKIAKGIYLVGESRVVKRNTDVLDICIRYMF